MNNFEIDIRQDFPVFEKRPDLVYLDTAASALKPQVVIDKLADFYRYDYANVHRGAHFLGDIATERYENTRQQVAKFMNASSPREIVFGKNATEMFNLVAAGLPLEKVDTVLLTATEHHANHVPWLMRAKRDGIKIDYLEFDPETKQLIIDEEKIKQAKVVALTHVSNVLGAVNDLQKICSLAKKHDAITVVDGCQAIAHLAVDVAQLNCDFYVWSAHKLYAPTGVGVLYGKLAFLKKLPPFLGGGEMIGQVTRTDFTTNEVPYKFEAGTPPIGEVVGLGAALTWFKQFDLEQLHQREQMLSELTRVELRKLGAVIYSHHKATLVTFALPDINSFDLNDYLSEQQICLRVGLHCAEPLHTKLGIKHSLRLSFGIYNRLEDITKLITAIKEFRIPVTNS